MRSLELTSQAEEDFASWQQGDPGIISEILSLFSEIRTDPFGGKGYKHLTRDLYCCRRRPIFKQGKYTGHRVVYEVWENKNKIIILSCRDHYDQVEPTT